MVSSPKSKGLINSDLQISNLPPSEINNPPSIVLLNRGDLKRLGISKSDTTLLRWELADRFPRRVKMARTSVAWIQSEIEQWLAKTADDRKNHHYADPD